MNDNAIKAAADAGSSASAAKRRIPWILGSAGVLAIMSLLCGISLFYTVSHAAISETVIVLDDSEDAARDYHIDIFRNAYISAEGEVTVLSRDGARLIAPGTSGEHMIRIRNDNAFIVEYEICVGTMALDAPECELPVCVRVTAGLESPKAWTNIEGAESENLKGMLSPGQEMEFYYQWRWDEGDDALDTWLVREYGDMKLRVAANISAMEYIAPSQPDAGSRDDDSGSGSRSDGQGGGQGSGSSESLKNASLGSRTGPGILNMSASGSYHTTDSDEMGWINTARTGAWYYSTDLTGSLYTGWLYEIRDGRWYYLAPESGKMCSGWHMIGGAWYYFTTRQDADDHAWSAVQMENGRVFWQYFGQRGHSYGAMYMNEYTPDGYFVDSEGRWVEGG